jgi:multidrug efflux pump
MQPVQDLTIEDRVSKTQYQFLLSSPDYEELLPPPAGLERLKTLPELSDVATDLQDEGLQAYVQIDREAAGRLGVSVAAIDAALYNAFGQRLISTIYTPSSQYRVVLEAAPEFRRGPRALEGLYVSGSTVGATGTATTVQVPLTSVAHIVERPAALAINHVAQFPSATMSFNFAPGVSLGRAVDAIRTRRPKWRCRSASRPASGRGGGLPRVAHEHALPAPRGGGHHVHRAGRAVRVTSIR